jgi:hypothetical protein
LSANDKNEGREAKIDGGATNADDGGTASAANAATAMKQNGDKGKRLLRGVALGFIAIRFMRCITYAFVELVGEEGALTPPFPP